MSPPPANGNMRLVLSVPPDVRQGLRREAVELESTISEGVAGLFRALPPQVWAALLEESERTGRAVAEIVLHALSVRVARFTQR